MKPDPDAVCIECGHYWRDHNLTVGCMAGWVYNEEGLAVSQGCECLLAHVELSSKEQR